MTTEALYDDAWLTLYAGDCRDVLAGLPDESVHMVITSPPYWGLRDYATGEWQGGDDPACDHVPLNARKPGEQRKSTLHGGVDTIIAQERAQRAKGGVCRRCGAQRVDAQLGLEASPQAYVDDLVKIFQEVRRVLRADGTVWLNLGDSYGGARMSGRNDVDRMYSTDGDAADALPFVRQNAGTKPKDLVGIPWRVAFALQADGWYLRSDVVWHKPNAMPESITDRPTKAHEYVFLLAKSRRYFYDQDAVREDAISAGVPNGPVRSPYGQGFTRRSSKQDDYPDVTDEARARRYTGLNERHRTRNRVEPPYRNLRTVWTIATQPYGGAHFAAFPEGLVEPCILAGTSDCGVCPRCGAPWRRVVELSEPRPVRGELLGPLDDSAKLDGRAGFHNAGKAMVRTTEGWSFLTRDRTTTGWQQACNCAPALPVPAVVLDPFGGTGTTGRVAARLSRRAILIDLNAEYLTQALERNRAVPLGLAAPQQLALALDGAG